MIIGSTKSSTPNKIRVRAATPDAEIWRITRSWAAREGSDQTILGWFEAYQRGFKRVGVVDVISPRETEYRWGNAAIGYAPQSDVWLMIFERQPR